VVTWRRAGRIALRTAAALAAALAILVLGIAPWLLTRRVMSTRFAYPDRENQGLTPASFDLPFEEIHLTAADGIRLAAWWVPSANARGTVVLVHGLNRSRIEMARKLPFVHAQGFSALVLDLRHHGASDGDLSSFGFHERRDVEAAVAYAREHGRGPIVVWGISLGAASVMMAAAEDPAVAGVVCDSSYRSLPDTVRHHLSLLRHMRSWTRILPESLLTWEVLFWMSRVGGFDPAAVDIVGAAARLGGRPALFVCNSGDKRMPMEIALDLKAAAGPQAHVLVVPGKSHGGAYREGGAAYRHAVATLFEEVMDRATDQTLGG
jgi:pimeloyl-ACP methyl ester carboxylesterase